MPKKNSRKGTAEGKEPLSSAADGDDDDDFERLPDHKLVSLAKQLPELKQNNYIEFKQAYKDLLYYTGYPDAAVDFTLTRDPWDGKKKATSLCAKHEKCATRCFA